jgi:ABC-type ATPase with predicted acetyltransferase domain
MAETRESTVPPEWVGHPHTEKLRRKMRERLREANANLRASARKSIDPDVRADNAEILAYELFLEHLDGTVGGGMQ